MEVDKEPFFLSVVVTDANNHNVPQYRAILWRKSVSRFVKVIWLYICMDEWLFRHRYYFVTLEWIYFGCLEFKYQLEKVALVFLNQREWSLLSNSRAYILNHFYLTTCLLIQIMVPDSVYLVVGYRPLIRLLDRTYPQNRAKDFKMCVVWLAVNPKEMQWQKEITSYILDK